MPSNALRISPDLSLPLELVTSTQGILARKRSGKSYTASVQAEELLEHGQQIAVIDPTGAWWGLRSDATGKKAGYPVVVFGGAHADAPLDFRSGKSMAAAMFEHGFSAIFDVKSFELDEQLQFVADFCGELLRTFNRAIHCFMDEADTFAPQQSKSKLQSRCLGQVTRLVKQGGLSGVGFTMITQRSASINWDVLSQVDILTILRMSAPHDVNPVVNWLQSETTKEFAEEVKKSLPGLPVGTAFFASAPLGLAKRVQVRKRRTFDSGRTPKPGEHKIVPKVLAKIDVQKLGAEIAATVQRAKDNSPEELKKRVRELEAKLAKPLAESTPRVNPVDAQLKAENSSLRKQVGEMKRKADALHKMFDGHVWPALIKLKSMAADILDFASDPAIAHVPSTMRLLSGVSHAAIAATSVAADGAAAPKPPIAAAPVSPMRTRAMSDGNLSGTSRKIACIAAAYGSIEKKLLAALCGATMGGSFSARLSEARTAGAIETQGTKVFATVEGREKYAGEFHVPQTTEEVMALWLPKLGGTSRQILEYLVQLGGEAVPRGQVAEAVGATMGGSFSARLSEVRSTGLLLESDGKVAANPTLLFLR